MEARCCRRSPALAGPDTLYLSIAAGRRIAGLEAKLPAGASVVRAMPNTPAAIGRGVTVAIANAAVTPVQHALAERLLAAGGPRDVGRGRGAARSGDGRVRLRARPTSSCLVECLAEAGRAAGLDAELAERLARHTVIGSAALLEHSDLDAAVLRQNVTSPGGTTAAALEILGGPDGLKKAYGRGGRRRNETRPRTGKVSGAPLESRSRPRVAFRT